MIIQQPTYCDGYASPINGGLLYPNLWHGRVGSWCSSLGPSGGVLWDHSGFCNHGTLTNGPTWDVSEGRYAVKFALSTAYVNFGTPAALQLSAGGVIAISLWLYLDSYSTLTDSGKYFDILNQWGSGHSVELWMFNPAHYPIDGLRFSTVASSANAAKIAPLTTGAWNHVYCEHTGGTGGTSRIAVNTVFGTNGTENFNSSTAELWLSNDGSRSANSRSLAGNADDIQIFNRPLSQNEITQLYQLGRGGSYAIAPRRYAVEAVVATGNRRRRVLIGACA